jgi:hypothetical protein
MRFTEGQRLTGIPPWILVAASVLAATASSAEPQTFTEDFTTTTYRDSVNTTAFWDIDAGELRLPPFVISLAGSYDTPGVAYGAAVAGDHAFVADESFGLQVIDISDPTNPTLAGSYDTPGFADGVAVAFRSCHRHSRSGSTGRSEMVSPPLPEPNHTPARCDSRTGQTARSPGSCARPHSNRNSSIVG